MPKSTTDTVHAQSAAELQKLNKAEYVCGYLFATSGPDKQPFFFVKLIQDPGNPTPFETAANSYRQKCGEKTRIDQGVITKNDTAFVVERIQKGPDLMEGVFVKHLKDIANKDAAFKLVKSPLLNHVIAPSD